jgi:hypothetical protein
LSHPHPQYRNRHIDSHVRQGIPKHSWVSKKVYNSLSEIRRQHNSTKKDSWVNGIHYKDYWAMTALNYFAVKETAQGG